MWGMDPSVFMEKLQNCEIPPNCWSPFRGWDFWQDPVSVSRTDLDVALLPFVVKNLFS